MERRLTKTEVVEKFSDDSEMLDAVAHWATQFLDKGCMTEITPIDRELVERLKYLLDFTDTTPVELEKDFGPSEVA